jgi:hypothetical protein
MTEGRLTRHDAIMARPGRASGFARLGFVVGAWLFVGCVVLQAFLVGLDIFAEADGTAHRDFAYIYGWLAPLLVLIGGVARLPSTIRAMSLALLVLFAVQTALPAFRDQIPLLAAVHTVNALFIFALALVLARRATTLVRSAGLREPRPVTPGP